jgi:GNAT superfamily N-acetyltransferase
MSLSLRPATRADLPRLATMNKQLIEDEGSPNPMTIADLQERMAGWLNERYHIEMILDDNAIVGYAIYAIRKDAHFSDRQVVFVRQFYLEREHRRQGIGKRAFKLLADTRFPINCTISLDVLAANPNGQRFWERLGFQPYYVNLKLPYRRA